MDLPLLTAAGLDEFDVSDSADERIVGRGIDVGGEICWARACATSIGVHGGRFGTWLEKADVCLPVSVEKPGSAEYSQLKITESFRNTSQVKTGTVGRMIRHDLPRRDHRRTVSCEKAVPRGAEQKHSRNL